MVRAFLRVYGDVGFFMLVAAVLLGGLSATFRVIGRWRRVPVQVLAAVCARCGGTGRFISRDGCDWPCLEPH